MLYINVNILQKSIKSLEALYNKAEQNCEAMAYLRYVEQAIAVPTQEDSAYNVFTLLLLHNEHREWGVRSPCLLRHCKSSNVRIFRLLQLEQLLSSLHDQ